MKIFKYKLEITDRQTIMLPIEHTILHADLQNGDLCLWVEVNESDEKEPVTIDIYGTGNPTPDVINRYHISTVMMPPYVWHVYYVHIK